MALIRHGVPGPDPYVAVADDAALPTDAAVLVSLQRWQDDWRRLVRRHAPVGVRLRSDEHPEVIADDLEQLSLVALEFPSFVDGRPYSHARLLRERYGFTGELRAVGDVLVDQLLYLRRVGFDAFELGGADPLRDYATAVGEIGVVYQSAADNRIPAVRLRHAGR